MAGRYRRLFLDKLKRDIDSLLVREKELSNNRIVRSAVAVFPLQYQGVDSQYAQLGYGMSEMISIDLGRVNNLKVLERIRLQALADELNFAQTNLVDRATAPRAGLLLGAGRVISGSFDVLKQKDLQVDVIASDIRRQYAPRTASQSDALDQFYRLEKAIVFGIIAEMGIELTQEERDEILRVPTRNLRAFLAYCKGLEQESNGLYLQAFRSFENAVKLDPGFRAAAERVEITAAASDVGQRREETFTRAMLRERLLQSGRDVLIADRLRHLGQNIGTTILLGVDKRKAVEEASISGLRELPTPPRPPDLEAIGVGDRKK
jgi:TolB-like protein